MSREGENSRATAATPARGPRTLWRRGRRFLPFAILLAGLVAVLASGLHRALTFEALVEGRAALTAFVEDFGALATLTYLAVQIVISALSIPAISLASIAGGFLFGPVLGTGLSITGQTLGALIVFLAVRMAFRDLVIRHAGNAVRRFETGFAHNAFAYIFVLRLVPVAPSWVANLFPGALGVPLRTFGLATLVGILPCTAIFTWVGNSLNAWAAADRKADWSVLAAPEFAIPLLVLSALSLMPATYWAVHSVRGKGVR